MYEASALRHCNSLAGSSCIVSAFWLYCACWIACHRFVFGLDGDDGRWEMPLLRVGEEMKREKLSFRDGSSREYEVHGLRERQWYEIKISYPASIPARFDIALVREGSTNFHGLGRKLLNIEKLTFHVDKDFPIQGISDGFSARILVVVHPEGVLSKQHTSDQPFIVYNIMCEEVILGIPKQAWYVGLLGALVLLLSYHISTVLPASLLGSKSSAAKSTRTFSKEERLLLSRIVHRIIDRK